jgi:hypothetical protein
VTGTAYLELILVSMGWFFFFTGLVVGLRFLPGVVGSLAAFFSVPVLARHGVDVSWPWLWILLPLVVDPLAAWLRTRMRASR